MTEVLHIHNANPQGRMISRLVDVIKRGGLAAIPTDASYCFVCSIDEKQAMERIKQIKQLHKKHRFTLMCQALSDIALYANVGNPEYRYLRKYTPGPFSFILQATHRVPRRIKEHAKSTVGFRIPQHSVCLELLRSLSEPIICSTALMPGEDLPLVDALHIEEVVGRHVDVVVDDGTSGAELTTVIDLSRGEAVIARQGKGQVD